MPVPYDAGGGLIRPAHFHMMISAEGYQSLITQIYFVGDPYISKDDSSASKKAASRILEVKEENGIKKVHFDVNMNDRLHVSAEALKQIAGVYKNEKTGKTVEFFAADDQLWLKNEVYGRSFIYEGKNTFSYPGAPEGSTWLLHFDVQKGSTIKLQEEVKEFYGNSTNNIYQKMN